MKLTATRIFLLIIIVCLPNIIFSQSVLKKLGNDKQTKRNKGMITELNNLFIKVNNTYHVDFDKSDTLFIIHGQDITNWLGYGYVWNNWLKISYNDQKEWKNNKVANSKLNIEVKTDSTTWYEFDGIVPVIENWDTTMINQYVNKHDEVLGTIYSWSILRLIKHNRDYKLDKFTIRDFGMIKK